MEMGFSGLDRKADHDRTDEDLKKQLTTATDLRLFAIAELIRRGVTLKEIHSLTEIDHWFLDGIKNLIDLENEFRGQDWHQVTDELLQQAKQMNIGDRRLAELAGVTESDVRRRRKAAGLLPSYHLVDTCAGEFEAQTPYYYSTWLGEDEAEVSSRPKILIVGSGPIRIGQGIEFDYCSVQATLAVKKNGYEAIVVNNNPETVSTDYSVADRLYFEPLAVEDILNVAEKEQVQGALVQFGGQTAVNVAEALQHAGIPVLGTSISGIDQLEDREQFYQLLTELEIPHIRGLSVDHLSELEEAGDKLGYPILVRPSFVIGGQSMFLFHRPEELAAYVHSDHNLSAQSFPLLVDRYMPGTECEVDAISNGDQVCIPGVFEHIERAGVHSGDSIAVFPSHTLPDSVKQEIETDTKKICRRVNVSGLVNIQFVIADGTVYVLEVNPRASRTVPIVSKVTGIRMVEEAVRIQLGKAPVHSELFRGLCPPPKFYAVKAPVFSFTKLPGVDPVLGPEMKSTGEALGMGSTVKEAFIKACFSGNQGPFANSGQKNLVLCSVTERAREESLETITQLQSRGFTILATEGTAEFYQSAGPDSERTGEDEGDLTKLLSGKRVAAVINVPTAGRNRRSFGFELRMLALRYSVPVYTCLDTVNAALAAADGTADLPVRTLDEYRQLNVVMEKGK